MGWLHFPKGWPEGWGVARGVDLGLGSVLELGQINFPIPFLGGGQWVATIFKGVATPATP